MSFEFYPEELNEVHVHCSNIFLLRRNVLYVYVSLNLLPLIPLVNSHGQGKHVNKRVCINERSLTCTSPH